MNLVVSFSETQIWGSWQTIIQKSMLSSRSTQKRCYELSWTCINHLYNTHYWCNIKIPITNSPPNSLMNKRKTKQKLHTPTSTFISYHKGNCNKAKTSRIFFHVLEKEDLTLLVYLVVYLFYASLALVTVDLFTHLPDLEHIIISNTSNDPIFSRVPWEIRNSICMATVDKEQLWWAVFCILWWLFLTNPAFYNYIISSHQPVSNDDIQCST